MASQDFLSFVVVIAISSFILAIVVIIMILNIYKQRVESQKTLLDAVYNAQENERTRIAEDLHDDIGARLSALKLRIDAIREDSVDPQSVEMAEESMTVLDGVVSDLRNIIRNQASKYLINNGFIYELDRFKKQLTIRNKVIFDIKHPEYMQGLDTVFGVNVFRILQELANNSIKHSGCTRMRLEIMQTGPVIQINYEDNGKGFDTIGKKNGGLGLSNIDARVKLYAGTYSVTSEPSIGTKYQFNFKQTVREVAS